MNNRSCGTCTLCCTLLGVPELEKPPRTKCVFDIDHKCSCYETRPQGCRDFECLWLISELPPYLKPNKTGCVLVYNKVGISVYTQNEGDEKKEPIYSWITRMASCGVAFVIVYKDDRHYIGPQKQVEQMIKLVTEAK